MTRRVVDLCDYDSGFPIDPNKGIYMISGEVGPLFPTHSPMPLEFREGIGSKIEIPVSTSSKNLYKLFFIDGYRPLEVSRAGGIIYVKKDPKVRVSGLKDGFRVDDIDFIFCKEKYAWRINGEVYDNIGSICWWLSSNIQVERVKAGK